MPIIIWPTAISALHPAAEGGPPGGRDRSGEAASAHRAPQGCSPVLRELLSYNQLSLPALPSRTGIALCMAVFLRCSKTATLSRHRRRVDDIEADVRLRLERFHGDWR